MYITRLQPPTTETAPSSPSILVPRFRKIEREFGFDFPVGTHTLTKHLYAYLHGGEESLGREGHFWEITQILWGPNNEQKQFIRNPWSQRMVELAHIYKYLGVTGPGSAAKTDTFGVYALVNWLANPVGTMGLVTSTSLTESRGRVWGSIESYWNAAQKVMGDLLPGKMVSSIGMIRLEDPSGEWKASDRSAIRLIAGEKKKEQDAIGKLIGLKNERVILIADELPELSPALIEAARTNLDRNPFFQMVGLGNANSMYDPHGVMCKPEDGWASITVNSEEWRTAIGGYCLHLDAEKSPNVIAGETLYKFLPTREELEEKRAELGEDSFGFWRMYRGFWCPSGAAETVVSEVEVNQFNCDQKVKRWKNNQFIQIAFLDPGFTNGGDNSVMTVVRFGVNADNNKETIELFEQIILHEDVTNKTTARNFQIAEQYKAECEKRNIPPQFAGVDDTGAAAFGDIVHTVWSRLVHRVNFGGSATKRPVSAHDKTLACDKWKNRVTEIWGCLREYMRGDQVRGLNPDTIVELTARKMEHSKSGGSLKAQVETKEKMRARAAGKSPDRADSFLGALDILRSVFHFMATARVTLGGTTKKTWKKFLKKNDFVGKHVKNVNRQYLSQGQHLDRSMD